MLLFSVFHLFAGFFKFFFLLIIKIKIFLDVIQLVIMTLNIQLVVRI